jgi:hypothetical protein
MNMVRKLRRTSDGETVVKKQISVCEIMPGIKAAVSYEFEFVGDIMRLEYRTHMTATTIEDMAVNLISRMYDCKTAVSFSSDIELLSKPTHMDVRRVANTIVNTIGSEKMLRGSIDSSFMDEVRHADRNVIDVTSLEPYRGMIMHKDDRVKTFVFLCLNGDVVTLADIDLTVISLCYHEEVHTTLLDSEDARRHALLQRLPSLSVSALRRKNEREKLK